MVLMVLVANNQLTCTYGRTMSLLAFGNGLELRFFKKIWQNFAPLYMLVADDYSRSCILLKLQSNVLLLGCCISMG